MKQVITALLFVMVTLVGAGSSPMFAADATATPAPAEEAAPAATEAPAEEMAQPTLPEVVRQSTTQFQDIKAATDAGYGMLHGCVSGPTGGAMGVHYANPDIVGDGEIDATKPEALLYEQRDGVLRLTAVEYVVIAEAWDANHDAPPVLMGQLFNYNGAPNRYGLPAFYELHVWAWKHNPDGVFADWNPNVSCEEFTGMAMGDMQ